MPFTLSHKTQLYEVVACNLKKMTADPASGAATYGTVIAVPEIKTLLLQPAFSKKVLRGGGQLLSVRSKMTEINFTMTYAKLNLDAEAVIFGGAVSDTGVTPNQASSYDQLGSDALPYFWLEAWTDGADTIGGDAHIILYKCIADNESVGFADEDFHTMSVGGSAMQRISDSKWRTIKLNETLVAGT